MARLVVNFFGTFQVLVDGRQVVLATEKCRALLAYLAVERDRPHRREALSGLLWPEKPEISARINLRQTLFRLRSSIGLDDDPIPLLISGNQCLQLNPAGSYQIDTDTFERLLNNYQVHCGQGSPLCGSCREALIGATDLYQGLFLEGFSMPGSPSFELWMLNKQESYHRQVLLLLGRLGECYEQTGDYTTAANYARRLINLEPWRESFHRLLMRSLAHSGQRGSALDQYEACRQLLLDEMGIEPSEKTTNLYNQIQMADSGDLSGLKDSQLSDKFRRSTRLSTSSNSTTQDVTFVGRRDELAALGGHLAQALDGAGRVVFIRGEAGQGKSTLADKFLKHSLAEHKSLLVIKGSCDSQYGFGDPYQPFREALRMLNLQDVGDSSWRAVGDELVRRLSEARSDIIQSLAEEGPDLNETLIPILPSAGAIGPKIDTRTIVEQTGLFEQVTGFLRAVARSWPLIVFLDDLHWIDPASADLLYHLGRHLDNCRLMIIAAFRLEEVDVYRKETTSRERHPLLSVINGLERMFGNMLIDLDRADGRGFVEAYIDSEPNRLNDAFREEMFRRTGGNPLFVVETLRELQDRSDLVKDEDGNWVTGKNLNWDRLPVKVEAVIAERFGRLSDNDQTLLSAASVQGKRFIAELVAQVLGVETKALLYSLSDKMGRRHHLVKAVERNFSGNQPVSVYQFRHYLFQQYAYNNLDKISRSRLHEATAYELEALYEDRTDERASDLARHFLAAGIVSKSVEYLLRAGKAAYRLSANESAISFYQRALTLLPEHPPGSARDDMEVRLLMANTAPVLASRGYTAPEVRDAANRVLTLGQGRGMEEFRFPAHMLLFTHYSMLADYISALKEVECLFKRAESDGNTLHLTQAYHARGYLAFVAGAFHEALDFFDAALKVQNARDNSSLLPGFIGRNTWLTSLIRKAWTLWFLGFPDQSLAIINEIMDEVEQVSSDHDLAFFLGLGVCPILYIRREFDQAEVQARRLMELADKKNLHYFDPFGQVILGAVGIKLRSKSDGLDTIRAGVQQYRASGQQAMLTFCLYLLAESLGINPEAETIIEEALAFVENKGERFFEAELYRLWGAHLMHRGSEPAQVETIFQKALAIAVKQGAKSLELRAAMSLANFWYKQNRNREAHEILATVYGSFGEGFETPDLREARSLLVDRII